MTRHRVSTRLPLHLLVATACLLFLSSRSLAFNVPVVPTHLPTTKTILSSSWSIDSRRIRGSKRQQTAVWSSSSTGASAPQKGAPKRKERYIPKWKKKKTLAEELTSSGTVLEFKDVGLKGTIPVVFRQGNETRTTTAMPGQSLRLVATQAGQFIKYGCGKGECGTCECLVNGQWIRPCTATMPAGLERGQDAYTVIVKEVKAKVVSSGKFYSARSFVLGFWNNLLGMVGFVKYRRAAKKNWEERVEYESLIKQRTLEKKRLKELQQQQQQAGQAASEPPASSSQTGNAQDPFRNLKP